MTIELRLLGTVELTDSRGRSVEAALRQSKRVAVLAYLAAARPRGYQRREKLAALFWPELNDERARGALRTTLSRLRQDLGEDLFLTRGATEVALNPAYARVDVAMLDDAIAANDLDAAGTLYRGSFLDGVHVEGAGEELEQWIAAERERVRNTLLRALVAGAERLLEAGDVDSARVIGARAWTLAPTDEAIARQLLRLHLASGDRGSAMRLFAELSERLRTEFGVLPSPQTSELVERIRTSASAPARIATSVPTVAIALDLPQRKSEPAGDEWSVSKDISAVRARWRAPLSIAVAAVAFIAAWRVLDARRTPTEAALRPAVARWTHLANAAGPAPERRLLDESFVDSTGAAVVSMYGMIAGEDAARSPLLSDMWRLRGLRPGESPTWTRLLPVAGPAPAARWGYELAYDASSDRAVMHGGALGHSSPCANDTWVLQHASGLDAAPRWREVNVRGDRPPLRGSARGAYDAAARRLIAFGGHDCIATYSNALWILAFDDSSLATGRWIPVTPDSTGSSITARNAMTTAFDVRANRLFVHGGSVGRNVVSELWVLEHANGVDAAPKWRELHCAGAAPALSNAMGVFDEPSGTWVLFGGQDNDQVEHNTVWRVRGLRDGGLHCAWERLDAPERSPMARMMARGGAIAGTNALVVLGGNAQGLAMFDLWRLDDAFAAPTTTSRVANR